MKHDDNDFRPTPDWAVLATLLAMVVALICAIAVFGSPFTTP